MAFTGGSCAAWHPTKVSDTIGTFAIFGKVLDQAVPFAILGEGGNWLFLNWLRFGTYP
jgi:hypothetical protein